MRRRKFIAFVAGAAAAWPAKAIAQPSKVPVIGYLGSETPERYAVRLNAFRRGLSAAGFDEGRNVAFEYRWAEGDNDRLRLLAADLAQREVSLIMTPSSMAAALAARAATSRIPIVFEAGIDPLAFGLVESLSRPGGNITGATSLNSELGPKRLELLHELLPGAGSIAFLFNRNNPTSDHQLMQMQEATSARKLHLHVFEASTEGELEAIFSRLEPLRGGLVIGADFFYVSRSKLLADAALRRGIPAIGFSREFVLAGGLVSYGGIFADTHRQAGIQAGRILGGESPAELPIWQVTEFDLLLNLKTAKALGITIPEIILARADEVIE